MSLVEDVDASRSVPVSPSQDPHLLPLRKESLELELNRLFEGAFEACAGAARAAVEAMEPLMEACLSKLSTASTHLPPRADLFAYYAEGVHRRFCNLCQVLP